MNNNNWVYALFTPHLKGVLDGLFYGYIGQNTNLKDTNNKILSVGDIVIVKTLQNMDIFIGIGVVCKDPFSDDFIIKHTLDEADNSHFLSYLKFRSYNTLINSERVAYVEVEVNNCFQHKLVVDGLALIFNGFGSDFKYFVEVDSGDGIKTRKYIEELPNLQADHLVFETIFDKKEANHKWETIKYGVEHKSGEMMFRKEEYGTTKHGGNWKISYGMGMIGLLKLSKIGAVDFWEEDEEHEI